MSIVSSASATATSLFGTVTTTANTVTRSINTIAAGMDMLDNYVQRARKEQLANSIADDHEMMSRVRERAVLAISRRQRELMTTLQSDSELAKLYAANDSKFDAIQAQIEARLNQL